MNLAQARKLKRGDRVFYDVENGARGMVKKHVLSGVWIHWEGRPKAILHLRTDLKEVRLGLNRPALGVAVGRRRRRLIAPPDGVPR